MNQPAPSSNLLLAALAHDDFALLRPHLTYVQLNQQTVIQEAEKPIEHVYFVLQGMVSIVAVFEADMAIEIAGIGREGAVGTKIGLHPQLAFARALVQLPGTALRMGLEKFQHAARQSLAITHLATCANDVMTANVQQSAACNVSHELEQRLARWLLHARDRADSDTLPLTQEFLSQMLGVRRTTVTLAAHALQELGVVKYRRGSLQIVDRAALEAMSCGCYRAVRRNVELILQTAKLATDVRGR